MTIKACLVTLEHYCC